MDKLSGCSACLFLDGNKCVKSQKVTSVTDCRWYIPRNKWRFLAMIGCHMNILMFLPLFIVSMLYVAEYGVYVLLFWLFWLCIVGGLGGYVYEDV